MFTYYLSSGWWSHEIFQIASVQSWKSYPGRGIIIMYLQIYTYCTYYNYKCVMYYMRSIIEKGPQSVSFMEWLSSLWRLKWIEKAPQSVSFIGRLSSLCCRVYSVLYCECPLPEVLLSTDISGDQSESSVHDCHGDDWRRELSWSWRTTHLCLPEKQVN